MERPVVQVEPGMRFGQPHIRGISTEAIADVLRAEKDPDVVCDEYGLTRHEVLVACWFQGIHGTRKRDRAWRKWAEDVAYPQLAGWKPLDVSAMPLPPGVGA